MKHLLGRDMQNLLQMAKNIKLDADPKRLTDIEKQSIIAQLELTLKTVTSEINDTIEILNK